MDREVAPGEWQDDRLILWMTPSFAVGRLQSGSGRVNMNGGELISHVGAVSDIAPGEIVSATRKVIGGPPLVSAAVRLWGERPRQDLGFVAVLFALAPLSTAPANDPTFQSALRSFIATGAARLHVTTQDNVVRVLDIPIEMDTSIGVEPTPRRESLVLMAAPNPFNPMTTLSFTLAQTAQAKLEIVRVDGRHVATLIDGRRGAGSQSAVWRGRDDRGSEVASGVYLARLQAEGAVRTQKLILVR
jgi:hypothetical protein